MSRQAPVLEDAVFAVEVRLVLEIDRELRTGEQPAHARLDFALLEVAAPVDLEDLLFVQQVQVLGRLLVADQVHLFRERVQLSQLRF